MSTCMPGGAMGVQLKSNALWSCAHANYLGVKLQAMHQVECKSSLRYEAVP